MSRGEVSSGRPRGSAAVLVAMSWAWRWFETALLAMTVALLLAGGVAWMSGSSGWAEGLWAAATIAAVVPAAAWVVAAVLRRTLGVDLIAVLALLGTLAVGEYLAGALIAVMLATGRALDAAAQPRATRDLRALLERAPRAARRRVGDLVTEVAVDEVAVGDLVVVGPGEVLPVDGLVAAGPSGAGRVGVDRRARAGRACGRGVGAQRHAERGRRRRGALLGAGRAEPLRRDRRALVGQAGAESAPVIRLADRFAAWFLPLSLALAGLAWWASRSAERAVAVLVVATPCPPAAAGRAGRDRVRAVAGVAARGGRAQRRRVGEPRPGPDDGAGQDRNPHRRATHGDRSGHRAGPPGRRGAPFRRRLGRPAFPARAGRGGGRRGAQARAGAGVAERRRGGTGPRRHRRRRRRPGAGG